MKVIQINGFRGLLTALFIGVCLFAGFVVFPGYVSMYFWNKYLVILASFPVLNLFQGVLLWGIIFLSYSVLTKGGFAISFKNGSVGLSDQELNRILQNAKFYSQIKKEALMRKDKFEKSSTSIISTVEEKKDKEELNIK